MSLKSEGARVSFQNLLLPSEKQERGLFWRSIAGWLGFLCHETKLIATGLQTLWPQNLKCSQTIQFYWESCICKSWSRFKEGSGLRRFYQTSASYDLSRRNKATQKYCSTTANRSQASYFLGRSWFLRTFPGVILAILWTQNSITRIRPLQQHKYFDVAVKSNPKSLLLDFLSTSNHNFGPTL